MKAFDTKNVLAAIAVAVVAPLAHAGAGVCNDTNLASLAAITHASMPVDANCLDASTDQSAHIKDSYNETTKLASTNVKATTNQKTKDTQDANVGVSQSGARQSTSQGDVYLGSPSAGYNTLGGGYDSPVRTGEVKQANTTTINGPNWGAVNQANQASTAGDAVNGPKAGVIAGVIGNTSTEKAGDQNQRVVSAPTKTSENNNSAVTPIITRLY